jgi:hypothetical protein
VNEALVELADHVVGWHMHVDEEQLRGVGLGLSDLVQHPSGLESGGVLLDDGQADAA